MKVYHYRNIDSAIKELDNGSFHFSSTDDLNDPLEGYVDMYWLSDSKKAWKAQIYTYGLCLLDSLLNFFFGDYKGTSTISLNHVVKRNSIFSSFCAHSNLIDCTNSLEQEIFNLSNVSLIINYCSTSKFKISKQILIQLFKFIHFDIFKICLDILYSKNIVLLKLYNTLQDRVESKIIDSQNEIRTLKKLLESNCEISSESNSFLEKGIQSSISSDLEEFERTLLKNNCNDEFYYKKIWLNLEKDFPRLFVDDLSRLYFSDTYLTCFSFLENNPVLWGNYADSHKGVCLSYDFPNNKTKLKSSNSDQTIVLNLQKVEYENTVFELNYFEFWDDNYPNNFNPNNSNDYQFVSKNKDLRKFKEWSYEQEYRLILHNTNPKLMSVENRNFRFNFLCLKGVIFGINTSYYDKLQIIQRLRKHSSELPSDFLFYQEIYRDEDNCLDKIALNISLQNAT